MYKVAKKVVISRGRKWVAGDLIVGNEFLDHEIEQFLKHGFIVSLEKKEKTKKADKVES